MLTTPAQRAGTDEPTGPFDLWQDRPVDSCRKGISSCANSSNAELYRFYSRREISRSSSRTTSPSCSSTSRSSFRSCRSGAAASQSRTPSTVIGSRGGAVAVRKRRRAPTGGATPAEAGACPPTRPAACRRSPPAPEDRQRVCGRGGCGGRLRYRTLHYANARVRTPTDHGLSVSIPIGGVSA